jgi:hypothetical protein
LFIHNFLSMFIQNMSQFICSVFYFSHLLPCLLTLSSFFLHSSIAFTQLHQYSYQTMGWTKKCAGFNSRHEKHMSFPHRALTNWKTHSIVRLTTGPKPLPKRVLHRMRYSASFSNKSTI